MKRVSQSLNNLYGLSPSWKEIDPQTADFEWIQQTRLALLSDRLVSAAPASLHFVGAVRPARLGSSRNLLRLIAVGRARTPYSIIAQIARAIAPVLVETDLLPIIEPLLV